MASDSIGFGILGLGFMGRMHFGHLRHHPRAHVTAVFDRSEGLRRGEWGGATGNLDGAVGGMVSMDEIRAYDRWQSVIEDDDVRAVVVALPTPLHADVTVAALSAGKHVFCEKPMALRLPDCDRMIDAANRWIPSPSSRGRADSTSTKPRTRKGPALMIGQCIRFWPQYEKISELIRAGAIGPVQFLSLKRLASPPSYSRSGWLMDHRQSGGAIFDLHVHDIDFAQDLLGVPERLEACGCVGPTGGIDHVMALYRFSLSGTTARTGEGRDSASLRSDGCYATLEGGWLFPSPWPFEMSVTAVGETGTLEWTMTRGPEVLHYAQSAAGDAAQTAARRISCAEGTGWGREMDYFITCLAEREPVARCTPESSRVSVGLALLERRAVQTGRSVAVPKCIARREICRAELQPAAAGADKQ